MTLFKYAYMMECLSMALLVSHISWLGAVVVAAVYAVVSARYMR